MNVCIQFIIATIWESNEATAEFVTKMSSVTQKGNEKQTSIGFVVSLVKAIDVSEEMRQLSMILILECLLLKDQKNESFQNLYTVFKTQISSQAKVIIKKAWQNVNTANESTWITFLSPKAKRAIFR